MSGQRILMTASTLPRWPDDAIPAFVLDQAVAIRERYPDTAIELLAPHDPGAASDEILNGIPIHRFRYFWPTGWQRLAYPAILPNVRRNPLLAVLIPPLILAEFIAIWRRARKFRATVIYSHWFTPQAIAGSLAARLLGIPHVFTTHSSDVEVLRRLLWLGPCSSVASRASASPVRR